MRKTQREEQTWKVKYLQKSVPSSLLTAVPSPAPRAQQSRLLPESQRPH